MRVGARPEGPLEALGLLARQVPEPLFDGYFALMLSRVVMAGVRTGILAALDERPDDADGLARRLGLDPLGVDVMLVALTTLGYLEQGDDRRYAATPKTRRHLVPGADQPLDACVGSFSYDMWDLMGRLEETLERGEPVGLHHHEPDDPWWESYMRGLYDIAMLRGDRLTKLIPAREPRRLLDLAGGHGGFSVAMCRRHPKLRATVLELEGAARIGREITAATEVGDRIEFEIGDIFESPLGDGWDVAMANSILHHFDAERNVALLRRARAALAPGGTMAAIEQERPRAGHRDSIGALTGVLFYVSSRVRTYTAEELRGFFEQAGFTDVKARRSVMVPGLVVTTGKKEA